MASGKQGVRLISGGPINGVRTEPYLLSAMANNLMSLRSAPNLPSGALDNYQAWFVTLGLYIEARRLIILDRLIDN